MHNELHESLIHASPEDTSHTKEVILDAIVAYALDHFAAEEHYLKESGFPGYDEHCRQHREIGEKLVELSRDVQSRKTILATSLMKILRNWITEHVAREDLKFAGKPRSQR